ncbi:MAG: Tyrosine protein kinase:Serine/threonine protein kinase:Sel1-like repeat protein, partial [Solimicrobium sp.]|nr:Tyrosine protein kinase:Serine/threonine protein kinase:Sel1-like repeat protein [Solimicrobium sp.]
MIGINHSPSQSNLCTEMVTNRSSTEEQDQSDLEHAYTLEKDQFYTQAFDIFKRLGENNNSAAQNAVGRMYQLGLGVPQDYKEAMVWYRTAADQGSADGFLSMGVLHQFGFGVPQDFKEAMACFKTAAHTNHSEAQFQIGLMYMKGLGVKQSDTNTVKYLTEADENNHPKAAFMLGESFLSRSYFRRDMAQALIWYKKASKAGNGDASYKLAELLMEARNKEDAHEIRRYLNLAIKQGHPTAEEKLEDWETNPYRILSLSEEQEGTELQHAQSLLKKELYAQAFYRYKQLADETGNASAFHNMGYFYSLGIGISQNYEQAMSCFSKAAVKGRAAGFNSMGILHQLGFGVPQDFGQAKTCYEIAAKKKSYYAHFHLALLYRHGLGVEKNELKAEECVNKAVALGEQAKPNSIDEFQQRVFTNTLYDLEKKNYGVAIFKFHLLAQTNHAEAQFQLGLMYMKGLGVEQSDTNAAKYLMAADENNHPNAALTLGEEYMAHSAPERLTKVLAFLERKDYSSALIHLPLLANDPEAQFQLGLMYMKGLGVKQSDANTVKYLTKAYENNHPK